MKILESRTFGDNSWGPGKILGLGLLVASAAVVNVGVMVYVSVLGSNTLANQQEIVVNENTDRELPNTYNAEAKGYDGL